MKYQPGVSFYDHAKIRRETIQHLFNEVLQQTFQNAIQLFESAILNNHPNLKQALANALEPYQFTLEIINQLEESGRRIIPTDDWLDMQWYNKTEAEIYSGLSDAAKAILIHRNPNDDQ